MKSVVYQLSYDFMQEDGHYLVLSDIMKRPLENKDLVPLHLKMLQTNTIPHLLPIRVEEVNFQVRLLYKMPTKRMLGIYLRECNLSMKDYYTLFINIISVLEDSQLYMLNKENYILLEDFIFVGKDIHDIYLTYLPLKEIPEKEVMHKDLVDLLLHIASSVQELEGNAFKTLLNYVKGAEFTLTGLKEKLCELQSQHNPSTIQEQSSSRTPQDKNHSTVIDFSETESRPLWAHDVIEKYSDSRQEQPFVENERSKQPKKSPLPKLTLRENILLFGFISIALALIWKLYESYSNVTILYGGSGLSLLIALGAVLYWKFWRSRITSVEQEGTNSMTLDSNNSGVEFTHSSFNKTNSFKENSDTNRDSQPSAQNMKQYYGHLGEKTTLLSRSDDTVLLNEETASPSPFPYLTIKQNEEVDNIDLQEFPFIIGRNPSSADYIEQSPGVSRSHLEIIKQGEGFAARDLGSKNGSLLSEQPMVAFKMYPLNEGDQITIGKSQFIFCTGSSS